MNNKTEQSLTDEQIDHIESVAMASFRRHQRSIKGQILTAAYDWRLSHAAYKAGIDIRAGAKESSDADKT